MRKIIYNHKDISSILIYIFVFAISDSTAKTTVSNCQQCKLLSESFNYWMEKTSRGKHEGGDSLWEEQKMKSYVHSEIRLVEIQEGLCSEVKRHQDKCYEQAEKSELLIESWWFDKQANEDLNSFLCIETLKYCCPKDHFGKMCEPCAMNDKLEVCSNKGKCDGEGTREGNGTCICSKGYDGGICDECFKNYYEANNGQCDPCHISCDSCNGKGPDNCIDCKSGWQLISGVCQDINECLSKVCSINEYCVNRDGSYICKPCDQQCASCSGTGPKNCSSCADSKILSLGMCMTEDEKDNLFYNALKRTLLYTGLLVSSLFVRKTSNILASIIVIIIAIYIYYSEKNISLKTMDILIDAYV